MSYKTLTGFAPILVSAFIGLLSTRAANAQLMVNASGAYNGSVEFIVGPDIYDEHVYSYASFAGNGTTLPDNPFYDSVSAAAPDGGSGGVSFTADYSYGTSGITANGVFTLAGNDGGTFYADTLIEFQFSVTQPVSYQITGTVSNSNFNNQTLGAYLSLEGAGLNYQIQNTNEQEALSR